MQELRARREALKLTRAVFARCIINPMTGSAISDVTLAKWEQGKQAVRHVMLDRWVRALEKAEKKSGDSTVYPNPARERANMGNSLLATISANLKKNRPKQAKP